jgi:hypothetical protein
MNSAIDLLQAATEAGARFTISGDRLTVAAPRPLPAGLVDQLRRSKSEVIALLAGGPVAAALDEERAAIVAYGGGAPRAWAEGFAQLDPDRPPADVPPRRWQQFIDDASRFLDSGFAVRAAALGWGAFDIFGCDRDRPFARIDQQGLCWLIAGNRLVDLSEKTAIIETWTGARQTWHRKPSEGGRVLAWELARSIRPRHG